MKILFNIDSGVISYMGKTALVNTQVGRVLYYLNEKSGTIVSKEEILEKCWEQRGVVVSLNALRQTMYRLRRVLEEIEAPQEVLLTKGRNGYLFQSNVLEIIYEDAQKHPANESNDLSDKNIYRKKYALPSSIYYKMAVNNKKYTILMVTSISVILFALGLYLRSIVMINTLQYNQLNDYLSIKIFVERKSSIDEKEYHLLIKNYLVKYKIIDANIDHIYINENANKNHSFIVCNGNLESRGSSCKIAIIIKDIK